MPAEHACCPHCDTENAWHQANMSNTHPTDCDLCIEIADHETDWRQRWAEVRP